MLPLVLDVSPVSPSNYEPNESGTNSIVLPLRGSPVSHWTALCLFLLLTVGRKPGEVLYAGAVTPQVTYQPFRDPSFLPAAFPASYNGTRMIQLLMEKSTLNSALWAAHQTRMVNLSWTITPNCACETCVGVRFCRLIC
jgi:hypothetical protein